MRRQIDYLAARSMLKFVSDTVTNLRNLTSTNYDDDGDEAVCKESLLLLW